MLIFCDCHKMKCKTKKQEKPLHHKQLSSSRVYLNLQKNYSNSLEFAGTIFFLRRLI